MAACAVAALTGDGTALRDLYFCYINFKNSLYMKIRSDYNCAGTISVIIVAITG